MSSHHTDTLNWDTVFAIPISKVNEAIVHQHTSPKSFNYISKSNDKINGNFGDWQIVKGGDGSLIYFSIPVSNVVGESPLVGGFAWERFSLTVEVKLKFLEEQMGEDSKMHLKIRSQGSNNDPVASTKGITIEKNTVTGENIEPTGDCVDMLGTEGTESIISEFISYWLNDNIIEFDHIFATVNLNNYIDKDAEWAWCKPTDVDYAYVDRDTEESLLGILCMTGGRKVTESNLQQIDPYVIPEKSIAGFIIAEKRILQDLVLPTLPMKWKKSSVEDYEIVNDADTDTGKYQYVLQLKEGKNIELDPISHAGSTYTPYMKKMKIALEEDQLIFESYTETNVGMGVTAWCRTTHWYTISLNTDKNGKQTLIYEKHKDPTVEHGTSTSSTTEVLEGLIILAGVIATFILGLLTDGVAFVVGAIIIGILTGVAAASPKIIEIANSDISPDIDLMITNATSPIQWNGSGVFNLNYAGLAGPLQLGGMPNFS
ncbi:TULIP family P47-like protein [Clostridium sp. Marseille-Q2269]|uniref:TULIP family P47-like protein n=1 Tax=Clostridium sp. Marseille-Q2269 TaxID=2942205 RepID=UPI002073B158|nr:TULIP family P47-like protein [Clostridium sp. Marseille-Q2269]